jgi:lysophospholipase L1-like esterase
VKQVAQRIVLGCVGIFLALALCESLIWLAPQRLLPARLRDLSKRMELYRSTDGMYVADSELLFKIRPHTDTIVDHPDYHVRIKTNLNLADIGFRGGSLGGPAWAVALGDSFTFGVGMDQQDTWVYLLAQALGKDIINFGIPSQGPAQYTRILKRYALPLKPRLAFYGFYFNDLNSANRFNRLQRNRLPVSRYLRQYSILYNLIRESRPTVAAEEAAEPADGDGAQLNIAAEDVRRSLARQNRNFEQRWQLTAKEIDDAIQASKDAQVEMVMLYLPSRWEVYWEQLKAQQHLADGLDIDRLRRTVVEYCGQRKLACFDLTPVLKREAQRGKQLYFPVDGHWNKAGNRIVAEALQKFLSEKGLAG